MDTRPSALLMTVTGPDRPGITSAITAVMATHQVEILDVEQAVSGGNLSLSFRLDVPWEDRTRPLFKDLIYVAWSLDVRVEFKPLSAAELSAPPRTHYALTLLGAPITAEALSQIASVLAEHKVNIDRITRLSEGDLSCLEMSISSLDGRSLAGMKQLLLPVANSGGVDLALQREGVARRVKRLVVFDMDSTLIQAEIIDELARARGIYDEVAAITHRAMAGEMDFCESLRKRVAMLEGTEVATLEAVMKAVPLMPGARDLVTVLKRLGYRTAVISGGFSFFTDRLKSHLGLDYAYSNRLEIENGVVTGKVLGGILDGQRKADLLETLAQSEGVGLDQVIAIGDGANDLPMLERAGLGIAFNAKRAVREKAGQAINRPRLDSILYLLGFKASEIAELVRG